MNFCIDIFCPMESEYEAIKKVIYQNLNELSRGRKIVRPHLIGVGKLNAFMNTFSHIKSTSKEPPFDYSRVAVLFGCCGSFGLPYGTRVVVTKTCQADFDTSVIDGNPFTFKDVYGNDISILRSNDDLYLSKSFIDVSSISQDKFFTSDQIETTLNAKDFPIPNASVADMEDYAFALACRSKDIPWNIYRVVSDNILEDSEGTEYDGKATPLEDVLEVAADKLISHILTL